MTLEELINSFRIMASDKVEPYFWSDEEVVSFINEAQHEAAIRGRLLYAVAEPLLITEGQPVYQMPKGMYEPNLAIYDGNDDLDVRRLLFRSMKSLDMENEAGWQSKKGTPKYLAITDNWCRIVPIPEKSGSVLIEGYRLPEQMLLSEADTVEPEIAQQHHGYLVYWALHKAFSIPDTEVFDPQRSQNAEQEFTSYFGLRPDSYLRRDTRLNQPHVVEAFWI